MSIGYVLGDRNEIDENIVIPSENDPNVISYSPVIPIIISRMCQNNCPYCSFSRKDSLTIPYSTIRSTKAAKKEGIQEVFLTAGERPDTFPHIKSLLELWGFDTYVDYIYTICELAFLEGLIPTIEVGFLSPKELKRLQDICAAVSIMLDSIDTKNPEKIHPESSGKHWDIRFKQLEWASKMKFPISTGLLVGVGELKGQRKEALKEIAKLHKDYGMIHDVKIQNFVPQKNTALENRAPATKEQHLHAVETALSILPEDVTVTVPFDTTIDIEDFISAGIRDLGRVTLQNPVIRSKQTRTLESFSTYCDENGFQLLQRLALKRDFIVNNQYSKKLGQVFDNYKFKFKKDNQERLKQKA